MRTEIPASPRARIAKTRHAPTITRVLRRRPDPPRGVLRAAPEGHRFQHHRFLPSPALAPFVEHFWSVSWNLDEPFRAETLPHPSVHITFENGRAEVGGVHTRKWTRALKGKGRVFAIKFRPAAFQPFVEEPVSSLSERVERLSRVFGTEAKRLEREVLEESDLQKCIAHCEQFLLERKPKLTRELTALRDLVERLAKDPSITRVEQLVELSGEEKRTLQRKFRRAVGVTPKWTIQRYRLHEAAERLKAEPRANLAELAAELGYFDQPHFIRDFKKLIGLSPAAFAREHHGARPSTRRP